MKCAQIPESKPWLADFAWGDEDEVDVDKLLSLTTNKLTK